MAFRRNIFAPSEDDITAAVVDHWKLMRIPGSLVAAIPNKRAFGQAGLTPGLPDLLVISPKLGRRTGYIELKAEGGTLSEAQLAMRDLIMVKRRLPYALTFGRDEPIRQLEKWGAVKRAGGQAAGGRAGGPARAAKLSPERRREIGRLGAMAAARIREQAKLTGEPPPLSRKQRSEISRQAAQARRERRDAAFKAAMERLARAAE